jgi:hypothetical protein
MLIFTPNKRRVLNLYKYKRLEIDNDNPGTINAIECYTAMGARTEILAEYKTEERAKEVLLAIVRAEARRSRTYAMPEK